VAPSYAFAKKGFETLRTLLSAAQLQYASGHDLHHARQQPPQPWSV
jgi:hypothetical protein